MRIDGNIINHKNFGKLNDLLDLAGSIMRNRAQVLRKMPYEERYNRETDTYKGLRFDYTATISNHDTDGVEYVRYSVVYSERNVWTMLKKSNAEDGEWVLTGSHDSAYMDNWDRNFVRAIDEAHAVVEKGLENGNTVHLHFTIDGFSEFGREIDLKIDGTEVSLAA